MPRSRHASRAARRALPTITSSTSSTSTRFAPRHVRWPGRRLAERPAQALRLYRHLALFVADNFQHMNVEETANNATLWAHYGDEELMDLHHRILASLPPAETLEVMRWMIPASSPAERAQILGGMKAAAPAAAFQAVLDAVRPHLDDSAWGQLARAIGVAQQPGLVDFR